MRAGNVLATAWVGTMTLILAAQATLLAGALGYEIDRNATLAAVIELILLFRANLLPKSRPAWFNGVALPVFAGNSDVWRRVHRASAVRLIAIALAALALAILRPAGVNPLTDDRLAANRGIAYRVGARPLARTGLARVVFWYIPN